MGGREEEGTKRGRNREAGGGGRLDSMARPTPSLDRFRLAESRQRARTCAARDGCPYRSCLPPCGSQRGCSHQRSNDERLGCRVEAARRNTLAWRKDQPGMTPTQGAFEVNGRSTTVVHGPLLLEPAHVVGEARTNGERRVVLHKLHHTRTSPGPPNFMRLSDDKCEL